MPHVLSSRRTSTRPHVSDRGARSTRRGRAHRPRPAAPPAGSCVTRRGPPRASAFAFTKGGRESPPTASSWESRELLPHAPRPRLPPAAALLLLLGAPSTTPTGLRRVTAVRSGLVKGVSAPASSGPRGPAGRAHAAARAASRLRTRPRAAPGSAERRPGRRRRAPAVTLRRRRKLVLSPNSRNLPFPPVLRNVRFRGGEPSSVTQLSRARLERRLGNDGFAEQFSQGPTEGAREQRARAKSSKTPTCSGSVLQFLTSLARMGWD